MKTAPYGGWVAILNIPLRYSATFGPFDAYFDDILIGGLWLVGIGLSLWVVPWMHLYPPPPQVPPRRRPGAPATGPGTDGRKI
jgi:hypothetical protein